MANRFAEVVIMGRGHGASFARLRSDLRMRKIGPVIQCQFAKSGGANDVKWTAQ
jgi:hypothetical protein